MLTGSAALKRLEGLLAALSSCNGAEAMVKTCNQQNHDIEGIAAETSRTRKLLYLGSNGHVGGDVNGSVVGQARVFEAVSIQQVSGLGRELHSAGSARPLPLHHEGVVIPDNVPNERLRHLCWLLNNENRSKIASSKGRGAAAFRVCHTFRTVRTKLRYVH
jgi:hypothetical protein